MEEKSKNYGKLLLEGLRCVIGDSTPTLMSSMNKRNDKFWGYIVNGRKNKDGTRKYSSPTLGWMFDGINYALTYNDWWKTNKFEVICCVLEVLMDVKPEEFVEMYNKEKLNERR